MLTWHTLIVRKATLRYKLFSDIVKQLLLMKNNINSKQKHSKTLINLEQYLAAATQVLL